MGLLKKLSLNSFKKNALSYKNDIQKCNMKFLVASVTESVEVLDEKEAIYILEDGPLRNMYVGKAIYTDELNTVYLVIPYPEKNRKKFKSEKHLNTIKDVFTEVPEDFVVKSLNEYSYTEYDTLTFKDVFSLLKQEEINSLKSTIFYDFKTMHDILKTIKGPNAQYSLFKINTKKQ